MRCCESSVNVVRYFKGLRGNIALLCCEVL